MSDPAAPAALRAALARLRRAAERGRAAPVSERLRALGAVLEEWRDAGSLPRRRLAEALPEAAGFTRPVVERGLALAFGDWSSQALRELYERELGPLRDAAGSGPGTRLASGFPTTSVLLAGAIPSASLASLLAPLALGSGVLARPPARDPLTAPLLADSLRRTESGLAEVFTSFAFEARDDDALAAFLEADCVVATGSDATVARVAARVAPPRRLVAYGHRVSFAALGAGAFTGASLEDAAARLALDVALWDQLGCLSPVALLVAGGAAATRRVAEALADALDAAEGQLPRGEVPPAAAARIAHERAEVELRAAARGRAALLCGRSWTVVAEEDPTPRPAPLHRFVRVLPCTDVSGVLGALAPFAAHLAALGLAGFAGEAPALARAAAALGASRVAPLGALQAPPLSWTHDGQGVLLPLARLAQLEGLT